MKNFQSQSSDDYHQFDRIYEDETATADKRGKAGKRHFIKLLVKSTSCLLLLIYQKIVSMDGPFSS